MPRLRTSLALLLVIPLLSGCASTDETVMNAMVPPAKVAQARHYIDLLRTHQDDALLQDISPSADNGQLVDQIHAIDSVLPTAQPLSVKTVGYHTIKTQGNSTTEVALEYAYPDRAVLMLVTTQTLDGTDRILGISYQELDQPLEELNAFTFRDRGFDQYFILVLCAADLALSLYAFVLCLRMPKFKRKWLWAIFTLVGIAAIGVNWTTGRWTIGWINIRVPPVGGIKEPYGPAFVFFSVPIGALLFLAKRKALREHPAQPAPSAPPSL